MSYIKNTVASVAMLFTSVVLTSCNDFLDCEPLDKITPDAYFNSESDLAAYITITHRKAFRLQLRR